MQIGTVPHDENPSRICRGKSRHNKIRQREPHNANVELVDEAGTPDYLVKLLLSTTCAKASASRATSREGTKMLDPPVARPPISPLRKIRGRWPARRELV